jgi:hypothetical protein
LTVSLIMPEVGFPCQTAGTWAGAVTVNLRV